MKGVWRKIRMMWNKVYFDIRSSLEKKRMQNDIMRIIEEEKARKEYNNKNSHQ